MPQVDAVNTPRKSTRLAEKPRVDHPKLAKGGESVDVEEEQGKDEVEESSMEREEEQDPRI